MTLTSCSLLGDSLNTTVTVIATLQNTVVAYNTLTLTYLFIVGIAAQLIGIFGFWSIQKRFKLSTKVMFDAVMVGILLLDAWGMIGSMFTINSVRPYLADIFSSLDPELRFPPHMGILAVPGILRIVRLPMVQLFSDHDKRSHPSRERVLVLLPVQHYG